MKTQHYKILALMATDPDRWWLPTDFMKPELGEYFVGYEASARLSELAKQNKVESKKIGKYMARRLKQSEMTIKPRVEKPQQTRAFDDQIVDYRF